MRALVFDGETATVVDRPRPRLAEGQVLLAGRLAGICNTDLEIVRGYMGFTGTLGHELVGVVEEGPLEWRGKRVTSEINFACGRCEMCAAGLGRHCPNRSVMGILSQDGAFAERVAVPIANLHAIPDAVSDEEAVFVEPLAAAFEIAEQIPRLEGREALVLGDGKLGLLVAQVLHHHGARVLAVGKHDDHLALLADRGIATSLLADWDRTRRDLVVEATGSREGFELAMAATRPRGHLVLKSTVADRGPIDLAPLVIDEITVVGSRCGPFAPAIEALASGAIAVRPMIAARFGLEDAPTALAAAGERGALKVLLELG
ncbi:MAG: alcohol dehydrogenase catalytic domain-containing protein [Polyangiaceae bacterium]